MEWKLAIILTLVGSALCSLRSETETGLHKHQRFMVEFMRKIEGNATLKAAFEASVAEEAAFKGHKMVFPCEVTKSQQIPNTVHELRPSDVNVIAALGDSITAGNGIDAWTAITVLREKRGESWCIGGDKSLDKGVHTLANVLRKFNPNLKGYSVGYGGATSKNSWLNQAIPGSKAKAIPGEVDQLLNRMRSDKRIDFNNDWKIITLMIGGNDLCDYCEDRESYSPAKYREYIMEALDKLHATIPRTLVNLVPMADITPVPKIRTGILCSATHWALCDCANSEKTSPELKGIQLQFFDALKQMVEGGRYDTREDFTVVLQPHLVDQDFPKDPKTGKYDPSYIAPDCFHPNRKSHQGLAYFLWNTMLTPVGQKPRSHDANNLNNLAYKCPTEDHPYIFTNKNSGDYKEIA